MDTAVQAALRNVRHDAISVMLYGSRARGTSRPDSDIDLLALVDSHPGSYSDGAASISYYTPFDLASLAKIGSLFVLHLISEGVVVSDPRGVLAATLRKYAARESYAELRADLAVVLGALAVKDRDRYVAGLRRAGAWAARSAVYLKCAEMGRPTFEMKEASRAALVPELAEVLKQPEQFDLSLIRELGLAVLGSSDTPSGELDLTGYAVRCWDSNPTAARLLESVIGGYSQLEYTGLTLPLV